MALNKLIFFLLFSVKLCFRGCFRIYKAKLYSLYVLPTKVSLNVSRIFFTQMQRSDAIIRASFCKTQKAMNIDSQRRLEKTLIYSQTRLKTP